MGRLTELQVEAGRHVGRLYGEYERAIGSPPRHAASPQYERAYGRSDRQSDDEWCARAIKRHARLHGVLAKLIPSPANAARAMEVLVTLCVDNQQIAAAHIPSTAVALEAIAREFELTPRRSLPPSRRAPPRENARARRAEGLSREAWADVERQFSPGITDSELEQKWRAHQAALARARAMVDREEFRRQKRRSGPR
jgi:hypothetical protein